MILCFCGVIFLALNRGTQSNGNQQLISQNMQMFGILVVFIVSCSQAGINVTNRKLKDVHFAIIGFYHPILGMTWVSVFLLI